MCSTPLTDLPGPSRSAGDLGNGHERVTMYGTALRNAGQRARPRYPDLEGKVVVVTMAATGIGAAVAEAFGTQGSVVAVTSRDASRLADIAERIRVAGGTPVPVAADITSPASVQAAVDALLTRTRRIDVLVNNAGGFDGPPRLADVTPDVWRECLDRNLTSAYLWSRAAAPHLLKRSGAIVNVSSTAGETSLPHSVNPPYGAAKGGVIALTRHLAQEMAPRVRVNCVAPGPTATPRWVAVRGSSGEEGAILGQVALRRVADPSEQAWPIVFLASASAAYITGAVLPVNGGRFMR